MLVLEMNRPDTAPMPMFDIPMYGCQSRTCWARGAKVLPLRKLDWVVDGCTTPCVPWGKSSGPST